MGKSKLLIVEDDRDLIELLRLRFQREGFAVAWALTGEDGLALAAKEDPALVLLDVMLPGMDGLEVCRLLRRSSSVPIIFLTVRAGEAERLLGFKLGGDDYMMKPFSVDELVARVKAILKRQAAAPPAAKQLQGLHGIEIDHDRREVFVHGKAVKLTPKEFMLLETLIGADGKILPRQLLMKRVWGYDQKLGLDERRVDHLVCRLRRNLREEGSRILTVSGAGYRIKRAETAPPRAK